MKATIGFCSPLPPFLIHISVAYSRSLFFWFGILIAVPTLFACSMHAPQQTADQTPDAKAVAFYQNGTRAYQTGRLSDATRSFSRAVKLFQAAELKDKHIETLIALARVHQAEGHLNQAGSCLQSAKDLGLPDKPDILIGFYAQRGNYFLASGSLDQAKDDLERAFDLANNKGLMSQQAALANDIGNLYQAKGEFNRASAAYLLSAELSESQPQRATALTNAARVALKTEDLPAAWDLVQQGIIAVESFRECRLGTYLRISLAKILMDLPASRFGRDPLNLAENILQETVEAAGELDDPALASHAWGALGRSAELRDRLAEALVLTRKALHEAQKASQPASLYQWQWQIGQIHKALGNRSQAIIAFRNAVWTLASIRADLPCTYAEPQRSFREAASGICFQLVDLLLKEDSEGRKHDQERLKEVRELVELLKVYELREYFRDDCLDVSRTRRVPLEEVSRTAVVIYPILLQDRIELLVSLPEGLKRFSLDVNRDRLIEEILTFRSRLEKRTTHEYMIQARRLYDWLIKPLENDLADTKAETLVFVPDGPLRTIPMGAFHDGKRFLIERFATAVTPGLDMTDPGPLTGAQKCLAAGITQSTQGFPSIPHVERELSFLADAYEHTLLLDREFRNPIIKENLAGGDFSIVHLASHGQFKENVSESFILTFDSRLDIDRLDRYIGFLRFRDQPLEHLTLSACETAAGDEQAALGLAGVAVQAGARSALATLWHINDQASATLITEFYRQLNQGRSRGSALRRAKMKLLQDDRYAHPGYWSPFLLINNWL